MRIRKKKSIAKSDSQLLSTAMQYMKMRKTRRQGKPGKQIDSIHPIYKKARAKKAVAYSKHPITPKKGRGPAGVIDYT